MLKSGARVVLLACGSFNPPTLMHLRMLEVARNHLEQKGCKIIKGILSPVADSFGKPNLVKAPHRLAMAKAALETSDWIEADGWECGQATWSRTLSVLSHHRQQVRAREGDDVQLSLVVGGDVVESFVRILPNGENLWKPEDVRDIIGEYGLVVIARDGAQPLQTLQSMPILKGLVDTVQIITDDACPCAISSTGVRLAVKEQRSIKYTTPDAVVDYIRNNELYQ